MFIDTRSEFIFKDPDALDALLKYDWRVRKVLTDAEVIGEPGRPGAVTGAQGSPSILRHMQRLSCIKALHGVRRQGGRMRLWRIEEVLKLQVALDLKAVSGQRMSSCVEALDAEAGDAVRTVIAGWQRHVGVPATPEKPARLKRLEPGAISDAARIRDIAEDSVRRFVARARFDGISSPAFLL